MLDARKEEAFCTILREELQLATGCTEPIAVAYCAARLRQVLGERPRRILAEVSGNILKNVKSVVVPNTGGRRGLPAAIAVGVVAGDPEARLQVIAHVTEESTAAIQAYLDSTDIRIDCPPTSRMLDIRLTGWAGDHKAVVHVANNHTNIIYVERDGEVLLEKPHSDSAEDNLQDKSVLNVRDILTFAETVDVSRIEESVGRQLECNTAIAREGLRGDWGANIGSTLLLSGGDVETEARAWAAAGSDARMNGCEMPVVICSGSGNQGICHTLENAVAMISGCICDGAKASCASKIAMGVETGILGYNMYLRGNSFQPGDGIVGRDVEQTIRNVGILASQGMKETDRVILKIMTE